VDSFLRRPAPPVLSENLTQAWMGANMEKLWFEPCACFSASAHISALYASTFSASSKKWIWLLIMKHNDMKGKKYKIGRL